MTSLFFFIKHKTAYEMRISDWSSDVCSSDLLAISVHDHVLNAISDLEISLLKTADISGMEPAVMVNGCLGLGGLVPVSLHDAVSADNNFPFGTIERGVMAFMGLNREYFAGFRILEDRKSTRLNSSP